MAGACLLLSVRSNYIYKGNLKRCILTANNILNICGTTIYTADGRWTLVQVIWIRSSALLNAFDPRMAEAQNSRFEDFTLASGTGRGAQVVINGLKLVPICGGLWSAVLTFVATNRNNCLLKSKRHRLQAKQVASKTCSHFRDFPCRCY